MTRVFIATTLIGLVLTSCAPRSDLFLLDIDSTNADRVEDFLTFENDTIRVVYIFWAENGLMGLFIHNKLERPLYIDWKKCSYIVGTTKNDYWDESIVVTNVGGATSMGVSQSRTQSSTSQAVHAQSTYDSYTEYWPRFWSPGISAKTTGSGRITGSTKTSTVTSVLSSFLQSTFSFSLQRITKPERVTFIPPRTTIYRASYSIADQTILSKAPPLSARKDTTVLMPFTMVNRAGDSYETYEPAYIQIYSRELDPNQSPISFRSFVTYSTDESFGHEAYIDNHFYISKISMLPGNAFRAKPQDAIHGSSQHNHWAAPSAFYLIKKK